MSLGALVFMGVTWAAVLALAGFCFGKVIFGAPRTPKQERKAPAPRGRKPRRR